MNLLLFLITLTVSFLAVRLGALAFHVTGLDWATSKFQALSCFTGTGFTTRESELVTEHHQRRKIASVLIISGNIGLVTLIATFANSIRSASFSGIGTLPFARELIPESLVHVANLLLIILLSVLIVKVFFNRRVLDSVTNILRKRVLKWFYSGQLRFMRLLSLGDGYGISRVEVCPECSAEGTSLGSLAGGMEVLILEREGGRLFRPPTDTVIEAGDRLVCFGPVDSVRNAFGGKAD